MKTLFAFLLVLSVSLAARAQGGGEEHHHEEKGGEPWKNAAVARSVQNDALTLAGALGGVAAFTVAARHRRRRGNSVVEAVR